MKVTLEMDCDNDAFVPSPQIEVARILAVLSSKIKTYGVHSQVLNDINGNYVGKFEVDVEHFDFEDELDVFDDV